MGCRWRVARANFFKAVWLSFLFLKVLQFSVSFGIKITWFILAHKVLHSQAYLFSIICLLPSVPFPLAKLDYVQFPGWVMRICVLVSFCKLLPYEETLPLCSQVTGSVIEGSLCAPRAPLPFLSLFPSPATLFSSHIVLECIVFS